MNMCSLPSNVHPFSTVVLFHPFSEGSVLFGKSQNAFFIDVIHLSTSADTVNCRSCYSNCNLDAVTSLINGKTEDGSLRLMNAAKKHSLECGIHCSW